MGHLDPGNFSTINRQGLIQGGGGWGGGGWGGGWGGAWGGGAGGGGGGL